MAKSRRQLKIARVIRDSVSNTIQNRLSDPRITGLISVTEVSISPDTKNATVYLSIFGVDEKAGKLTFAAIQHAAGPIQAALGRDLTGRICPHLRFELDTKMKKTLQTLDLIDRARREYEQPFEEGAEQNFELDDSDEDEPQSP
jgi:ribosome-binding factor A